MKGTRTCPKCGTPLARGALEGLCPKCVAQLAFAVEAVPEPPVVPAIASAEKPGDRIGRYKLLQQIGEGGCGVVYLAEQQEPVRRPVALKVIKLGMDTKQVIARFEAERQALALMDHPSIAKVLDAGATQTGRPYFVMELVHGVSITEFCDSQRFSTRQRLELFIQVCQAVQHAHQKGIIHRDLKPSNILVTERDGVAVPKVIDFGIAKATLTQQLTDKTLFTAFEQFLGTPAYMSPEQAGFGGLDVDTRSDVYSLGVLLYELVTGRQPFDPAELKHAALDGVLRTICEQEPPRPSVRLTTLTEQERTKVAQCRRIEPAKLAGLLQGDLDWVVMKTLEKERGRRYETVNGLARDLERHLSNEPVAARPPSHVYRFQKLVRRNKLAFVATGAVTAAVLSGLGVSTWLFLQEKHARRRAVTAEQSQTQLRQQAQAEARRAEAAALEAKTTSSSSDFSEAVRLVSEDRAGDALAYLQRSLWANPENDAASTRLITLLTYHSWMTPTRVYKHSGPAQLVQYSPDYERVLTVGEDNTLRVWDARSDQPLTAPLRHTAKVRSAQFSSDGTRLLTIAEDNIARMWDVQASQLMFEFPKQDGPIRSGRFSPDGRRLVIASTDGTARVWDVESGHRLGEPLPERPQNGVADGAEFSPDGKQLVTISMDAPLEHSLAGYRTGTNGLEIMQPSYAVARVWDVQTGQQLAGPLRHGAFVTSARFSPDGTRLVTTSSDGGNEARVWELQGGHVPNEPLSPGATVGLTGLGLARKAAVDSPPAISTGSGLAQPMGLRVMLDSKEAPARAGDVPLRHSAQVLSARFSPDGKRIVTASEDKTARVWDARTGRPLTDPLRHHDTVFLADFSPDGRRVLTASRDQVVRVWDAQSGKPLTEPITSSDELLSAQFTSDGRQVATLSGEHILRLWSDRPSRAEVVRGLSGIEAAWFSRNGKRWDGQTGQQLAGILGDLQGNVDSVRFSLDAKRLVTWDGTSGVARVWDVQSGRPLTEPLKHTSPVNSAEFSPDAKRIVTVDGNRFMRDSLDGAARVWDVQSGQALSGPLKHDGPVCFAQFSPDGKCVVTASDDCTARLWDAQTGRPLTSPLKHVGKVSSARFSPDRKQIITAATDNAVRLWDAQTGKLLRALWCGGTVGAAEFSPDGRRFLTASEGNGVRVWDAQSGRLITDAFEHYLEVTDAQFSPDGKRIVTVTSDGTARLNDIAPTQGRCPAWLLQISEAIGGQKLNAQSALEPTKINPAETLKQIRERLNGAGEDDWTVWGRWYLGDPSTRTISPFSKLTIPEYIENRIKENTAESLAEAEQVAYGNAEQEQRIAHARLALGRAVERKN